MLSLAYFWAIAHKWTKAFSNPWLKIHMLFQKNLPIPRQFGNRYSHFHFSHFVSKRKLLPEQTLYVDEWISILVRPSQFREHIYSVVQDSPNQYFRTVTLRMKPEWVRLNFLSFTHSSIQPFSKQALNIARPSNELPFLRNLDLSEQSLLPELQTQWPKMIGVAKSRPCFD